MIVEFSIGNFWSFKEIQTLQMQAAKIKSKFPNLDEENVINAGNKLRLLKSKAVFGANASGKSNLLRAFQSMWKIIRNNISDESILENTIIPFKLNEENIRQPSFFQLCFILDDVQYRYGFEATKTAITAEWLFGKPIGIAGVRERYYFTREGDQIDVNEAHFKEGAKFVKAGGKETPHFRNNSLFLSVVAAFNGLLALQIVRFIVNKISIVPGMDVSTDILHGHSLELMDKNPKLKQQITDILISIDPSIHSIDLIDEASTSLSDFPEIKEAILTAIKQGHPPTKDAVVYRNLYNKTGKVKGVMPLIMSFQEAEGTKKLFALSPLVLTVLGQGGCLFIDELDAKFHPKLSKVIIRLFHSEKTNPKNAQLVFITHDSTLLNAKLLRRDQITFAQKDSFGATELYSLFEIAGVRNDASYGKDYLLGKYDAVPNLNTLETSFEAVAP